jgi:hypothetical protein
MRIIWTAVMGIGLSMHLGPRHSLSSSLQDTKQLGTPRTTAAQTEATFQRLLPIAREAIWASA